MTSLAPPVVTGPPTTATGGGVRSRSMAWMALPAFAFFFIFGLVPLAGVLILSFTTWDLSGTITPSGLDSWTQVLKDPGLPHSILVTFEVMFFSWLVQTPISLLLGVFLAGHQRYREFFAILFF